MASSARGIWPIGFIVLVAACGPIIGDAIGEDDARQQEGGSGGSGGGGGGAAAPAPSGPPMMTEAEAQAWCDWYVSTGYPNATINPPPPTFPVVDGHVDGYELLICYGAPFSPRACLVRPTVEHCVQNILSTWCEASVEALTECVIGMFSNHVGDPNVSECPTPGSCDAFVAAPGCDETIVMPMYDGAGGASKQGCLLRVE